MHVIPIKISKNSNPPLKRNLYLTQTNSHTVLTNPTKHPQKNIQSAIATLTTAAQPPPPKRGFRHHQASHPRPTAPRKKFKNLSPSHITVSLTSLRPTHFLQISPPAPSLTAQMFSCGSLIAIPQKTSGGEGRGRRGGKDKKDGAFW